MIDKIIIKKKILGDDIEIELEKIKDYPKFSLYQIYKIINDKRIALYKESFTYQQMKNILLNRQYTDNEIISET